MRRVAIGLCVASALVLLLPWQICDCHDDGPHLKVFWDATPCDDHDPADAPESEGHEDEACDELFYVAGAEAAGAVELPLPDRAADLEMPPAATTAHAQMLTGEPEVSPPPAQPPPAAPPLDASVRLLV